MENRIKVVVIGDGAVGKSSWIRSLLSDPYQERYIPTIGVSVTNFSYEYEGRMFNFALWDISGHPDFGGIRDGYFIGGHAAIIMHDASSFHTKSAASCWKRGFLRICTTEAIIYVRNKIDLIERTQNIAENDYIDVSCLKGLNIMAPIIELCKKLKDRIAIQNMEDIRKDIFN